MPPVGSPGGDAVSLLESLDASLPSWPMRPVGLTVGVGGGSSWSHVFVWLLVIAVAVVAGGGFVLVLRRRVKAGQDEGSAGFTLQDLREMHAAGQLSDVEYRAARTALLGAFASREDDGSDEGGGEKSKPATRGPTKP